ncbi:MAG: LysE family transporter [Phycisphaerae bacterium]|nr:LysE family transporter [Saprospiraceae bacterium]
MVLLLAGFVLSLFGSIPPGLISLTVSQTSIASGMAAAMAVAVGAAVAEFFQAWAAVLFTDWFLSHPAAERGFHWAAVPVFLALGIHLLFFAKPLRKTAKMTATTLRRQFAKGLIISFFNLLALPYWFVYCGWLRVEGWWQVGLFPTLVFSFGVSIGTVLALSLYVWLGQLILEHSSEVARYANRVIGLIFFGLGIKTLIGLVL